MSLDKLVDLLSTGELFFAPLSSFAETDPFEGYLPAVAMRADAEMFRQAIVDAEALFSESEHQVAHVKGEVARIAREQIKSIRDDLKLGPSRSFLAIMQSVVINCWHASDVESEAMWRLYADNGKAVVIETDADALKNCIQSRESQHCVHIYPVKYLDFFDENLKPSDCVVEGHQGPLLKRSSYQHEHEVRAFIGRTPKDCLESADLKYWQRPLPVRLPVDVKALVKRVHVSPYSKEPFQSSVGKICELLGLSAAVVAPSKLLFGNEALLQLLTW